MGRSLVCSFPFVSSIFPKIVGHFFHILASILFMSILSLSSFFHHLSLRAALHAKILILPFLLIHPLISSIHFSIHRDIIRWLCMGLVMLLLIHSLTHSLSLSAPLVLMEGDVASPLKILWMSSVRESWQPGALRLICLFTSNQCQEGGKTSRWRNKGEEEEKIGNDKGKQWEMESSSEYLIRVQLQICWLNHIN